MAAREFRTIGLVVAALAIGIVAQIIWTAGFLWYRLPAVDYDWIYWTGDELSEQIRANVREWVVPFMPANVLFWIAFGAIMARRPMRIPVAAFWAAAGAVVIHTLTMIVVVAMALAEQEPGGTAAHQGAVILLVPLGILFGLTAAPLWTGGGALLAWMANRD